FLTTTVNANPLIRLKDRWDAPGKSPILTRPKITGLLGFFQLADQRQLEIRAHVLEVRLDGQADTIDARLTFHILHTYPSGPQGTLAAHHRARIFLIRDIAVEPGVELALNIGTL